MQLLLGQSYSILIVDILNVLRFVGRCCVLCEGVAICKKRLLRGKPGGERPYPHPTIPVMLTGRGYVQYASSHSIFQTLKRIAGVGPSHL
jgi:hypothetical protein